MARKSFWRLPISSKPWRPRGRPPGPSRDQVDRPDTQVVLWNVWAMRQEPLSFRHAVSMAKRRRFSPKSSDTAISLRQRGAAQRRRLFRVFLAAGVRRSRRLRHASGLTAREQGGSRGGRCHRPFPEKETVSSGSCLPECSCVNPPLPRATAHLRRPFHLHRMHRRPGAPVHEKRRRGTASIARQPHG